jgi:hypothetical protein
VVLGALTARLGLVHGIRHKGLYRVLHGVSGALGGYLMFAFWYAAPQEATPSLSQLPILVLFLINCLSPLFALKTEFSLAMFSNLHALHTKRRWKILDPSRRFVRFEAIADVDALPMRTQTEHRVAGLLGQYQNHYYSRTFVRCVHEYYASIGYALRTQPSWDGRAHWLLDRMVLFPAMLPTERAERVCQ